MSGISANVLGQIILKTFTYFPKLYSSNISLTEIFKTVSHNATILSFISNATGLDENVIRQTVDVYLFVTESMKPTTAAPTSNTTNR